MELFAENAFHGGANRLAYKFDSVGVPSVVVVLLKKYLHQNARILGFNRDPKFNNALDGLMLLDVQDLPAQTVENLQREFGLG